MTGGRRIAWLGAGVAAEVAIAGTLFAAAAGVPWPTGMYWAVVTATTVGYGDVTPHGALARTVAIVVMLTVIPLLGALFAALTSMHVGTHVHAAEQRLRADAQRHQLELTAQATANHNAQRQQADRRHAQLVDLTAAQHEALKDHLTATLRLPAKQPRARTATKEAGT